MGHEPPKSHNIGIVLECYLYKGFYNIFLSLWLRVLKYEMAQIIDHKICKVVHVYMEFSFEVHKRGNPGGKNLVLTPQSPIEI